MEVTTDKTKASDFIVGCYRDAIDESRPIDTRKKSFKVGGKIAALLSGCTTLDKLTECDYHLAINLSYYDLINVTDCELKDCNSKIIAIYADTRFDPKMVKRGKFGAGSEIAIMGLSESLVSKGHSVYIFSNMDVMSNWEYGVSCVNPRFLPILRNKESDLHGPCGSVRSFSSIVTSRNRNIDLLILWREGGSKNYRFDNYAKKTILWSHDFNISTINYKPDFIYVLSETHKKFAQEKLPQYKGKYIVGCNGTFVNPLEDFSKKVPFRCIYASSYARGLKDLLLIWPDIKSEYPLAELHVLYGRETWGVSTKDEIDEMVRMMDSHDSVHELGMLPYDELVKEMTSASYLLFPYKLKAETFSIITALAQQLGTIAIVKRKDALREIALQEPDLLDNDEFRDFTKHMMGLPEEEQHEYALKQQDHASKYTWNNCANSFLECSS